MDRDTRILVSVAAVVLGCLALAVGTWQFHEASRPELLQARVVTSTNSDTTLRDGPRRLTPGEDAVIAVALQLRRPRHGITWMAPGPKLVLGGEPVEVVNSSTWPEDDRHLRVFWFTVEAPVLGGDLTPGTPPGELTYRPLLAPEMGRELVAASPGEPHNDDAFAKPETEIAVNAGTMRYYARVEVVERRTAVRPLQTAATLDAAHIRDPTFPTVFRTAALPGAMHISASELFGLPGFEPRGDSPSERNNSALETFGMTFDEVVEGRLATSSATFAAVAITGTAGFETGELTQLNTLTLDDDRILKSGRTVAWRVDVEPRDLLISGNHWIVLVADDGDGLLGLSDTVAHCWRRPPSILSLGASLTAEDVRFSHSRWTEHDPAITSADS